MSRHDRIKAEIQEAGVIDLTDRIDKALESQVVEELEYALVPPVHERRTPTYGCILTTKPSSIDEHVIDTSLLSAEAARQLAEGTVGFLLRTKKTINGVVCLSAPRHEEAVLIDLRHVSRGILIHRGSDDIVRVFNERGIYSHFKGTWSYRPYHNRVLDVVINSVPQADPNILSALMKFAFHVLSPAHVGATLVWWLGKVPASSKSGGLVLAHSKVNASDAVYFGPLRGLLSQHDGATSLFSDGTVASVGMHLAYSRKARKLVGEYRGTRHTSAKRFSFDKGSAVVIVVSEDGPVSVFSDGVKLTELASRPIGSTQSALERLAPAKKSHIETQVQKEVCPNCGKHILIEVVIVYGWREQETGECPVCGQTIASERCYSIVTRVVKCL